MKLARDTRIAIVVYICAVAAYAGASGARLRGHSNANHYVWMAYGWLHGRLDLGPSPPMLDDRAQVETVTLKDGRTLRGALLAGTSQAFRTTRGEIIDVPPANVARREYKYYVSFPPFPAVLMVPLVAIFGLGTNDVLFTVVLAGLAPALFFLLLRRLRARGDSGRDEREDLWLTAALGLGSVYYFASVLGQVWYTAHVVCVVATVLYLHFALDARRPVLAGLCIAAGFLSRPEVLFTSVFFLWELLRVNLKPEDAEAARLREMDEQLVPEGTPASVPSLGTRASNRLRDIPVRLRYTWHRLDRVAVLRGLILFGIPIGLLGGLAALHNYARFGKLTEFGHTYLNVRWTPRIQKFGLFNYAFLSRNLTCMLTLLPRVVRGFPWVQVSRHGLAMWVTTPIVLWALWPLRKGPLHRPLWLTTACVAIPDLLYQNSGWIQFGYRFGLDWLPFVLCLIAIGGRRFRGWFKVLVIVGIAINLFGAITFDRAGAFYFPDDNFFPPGID